MPAAPVSILPNAYAPPTPSAPAGVHGSFLPASPAAPDTVRQSFAPPVDSFQITGDDISTGDVDLDSIVSTPMIAVSIPELSELPTWSTDGLPFGSPGNRVKIVASSIELPCYWDIFGELDGSLVVLWSSNEEATDPSEATFIPALFSDATGEPVILSLGANKPSVVRPDFTPSSPRTPESIFGFSVPSPALPTGRGNFTPASPSAPNRGRSNFSPPSPAAPDAIQENFVPFVGPLYYYRPDGVSRYLRPDGFSYYLRPGSTEGYYPPEIGVDFSPDQPDAPNAATSSFSPLSPSAPVNGHGSFIPPSPSPPADINHGFSPSSPFAPSQIRGGFSPASPAAPSVIRPSSSIGSPSAPEIIHVSFSPASPDRPAAILPPLDSSTSTYFRPGGSDIYLRPDGESTYLR